MNTVTINNPTQYDAIREVLSDKIMEVGYSCGTIKKHPTEYYIRFEGSSEISEVVSLAYIGQELDLRFDDDGFGSDIVAVHRLRVEHSIWWEDCDQDQESYNAWLSSYNAFMDDWLSVKNVEGGAGPAHSPYSVFECDSYYVLNEFKTAFERLRCQFYINEILAQISKAESP